MINLENVEFYMTLARNQNYNLVFNWFSESIEILRKSEWSAMMLAASRGEVWLMEWLKSMGEDLNHPCLVKDFYDRDVHEMMQPLHIAVLNKKYGVVSWLCQQNVDINAQTTNGNTAMHFAVKVGDLQMVKLLAISRANINLANQSDQTPLYFAIKEGKIEIIKWLGFQGINLRDKFLSGDTLCHAAVEYDHIDIIQWLIEEKYEIDEINGEKETPLHYAARKGNKKIVNLLIKAGSQVDKRDIDGQTPLHHAVQYGHLDVVKFFYKNGSNLLAQDFSNATLVHIAAQYGELNIIKWVVGEQNIKMDCLDIDGDSPVHYAARNGRVEIIEYLRFKKCNINVPNLDNETPLFAAALEGHLSVVRYFHKKIGASVNSFNQDGDYLVHIAACERHIQLMKWLIEKGADINVQDSEGNTPLHLAIISKELEMISLLKEKGANVNIKNKYSQTALMCALNNEIEGSLFCTAELDLSDMELYNYLIKNIDQILSKATLREKILGKINILKSFESLRQNDDIKKFIQNLSDKITKIVKNCVEKLCEEIKIRPNYLNLFEYQKQINELDDILQKMLNLKSRPVNIANQNLQVRFLQNARKQILSEEIYVHDQNYSALSLKRELNEVKEHKPYKIQKIWDKATNPTCIIENKNNEVEDCVNFDKIQDSLVPIVGEINPKS